MKRSAKSIVLIALLAVFVLLCGGVFIKSLSLLFKHIEFYTTWYPTFDSEYIILYSLIAISELISIALSVIFIIAIWKSKASKVVYELYGDKIESFKQRKATKKDENLKNKIENYKTN